MFWHQFFLFKLVIPGVGIVHKSTHFCSSETDCEEKKLVEEKEKRIPEEKKLVEEKEKRIPVLVRHGIPEKHEAHSHVAVACFGRIIVNTVAC